MTFHGWLAGSDAVTNWMPAIYAGGITAVGTLTVVRWVASESPSQTQTTPATLWQSKVAMAFTVALVAAVFTAGLTFMIVNATSNSQQGDVHHPVGSAHL